MTPSKPVLTIFYDGHCPICSREIAWLRARNSRCRLDFQDIYADGFDSTTLGVSIGDLLAEIHGVTADGRLIQGIDVFAIAYSSVGLEWLAAPLQWPLSRRLFARLYSWFARYRRRLGGLCQGKPCQNDQCRV